ncbi:MAG: hypothetical protein ACRCT7_18215 [Shewanella sp.]
MSPLEQVINQACLLHQAGKTPSLALLKAKIKMPMPVLVKGLQAFKQLASDEITSRAQIPSAPQINPIEAAPTQSLEQQIAELQQQQLAMTTMIEKLTQRITELEQRA